ncbi:MAG: hypothetical protein AAGG79_01425 [Pseudomonadota bacterium]
MLLRSIVLLIFTAGLSACVTPNDDSEPLRFSELFREDPLRPQVYRVRDDLLIKPQTIDFAAIAINNPKTFDFKLKSVSVRSLQGTVPHTGAQILAGSRFTHSPVSFTFAASNLIDRGKNMFDASAVLVPVGDEVLDGKGIFSGQAVIIGSRTSAQTAPFSGVADWNYEAGDDFSFQLRTDAPKGTTLKTFKDAQLLVASPSVSQTSLTITMTVFGGPSDLNKVTPNNSSTGLLTLEYVYVP